MKIGILVLLITILIFWIRQGSQSSNTQGSDRKDGQNSTLIAQADRSEHSTLTASVRPELDVSQRSTDLVKMVPDASEIYLTDEELRSRVQAGLSNLLSGMPFKAKGPPQSMEQAYSYLQGLIPKEVFPQWGYETEGYYIFSGRRSSHYSEAFNDAYLIDKKTGDDRAYNLDH